MRRSLPLVCVAALAAMWMATAAAASGDFSLAVLRRDGILIPFATYTGRWQVAWPGSDNKVPLPISLADIPKTWWGPLSPTAPWKAWLTDETTRPVTLQKPVHVPIFCGAHLAIATDYRGAVSAEDRGPTVPKDGLATAGDVTILPITQISVNAPDATRMIAAITEKFNEEEQLAVKNFINWYHPYGPFARSRFPITLEAFYRAVDGPPGAQFRTNYIEAVRRFPAGSFDEGCGLITFVRGWVTELPNKEPVINLGARVTYCDRADVSFMQPFGRIQVPRAGGRGRAAGPDAYWVYQTSSWRDEFYSVARVTAEEVRPVLVVAGGGCPKEPAK